MKILSFDDSGHFCLYLQKEILILIYERWTDSDTVCTCLSQATRGCHCSTLSKMSGLLERVPWMISFCRNLKESIKSKHTSL